MTELECGHDASHFDNWIQRDEKTKKISTLKSWRNRSRSKGSREAKLSYNGRGETKEVSTLEICCRNTEKQYRISIELCNDSSFFNAPNVQFGIPVYHQDPSTIFGKSFAVKDNQKLESVTPFLSTTRVP